MKKKNLAGLATGLFLFGIVGLANATPFSYTATDTPLAIPLIGTSGNMSSTITVSENAFISDLNVFVDLTHTYMGDLDIFLEHNGTQVQLFNQDGYGGDNLTGVLFDDEANIAIDSWSPPFGPGTFQTDSSPDSGKSRLLSDFNTMNLSGDWQLLIVDNLGGDTGQLNTFRIEGNAHSVQNNANSVPEPATATMLFFGLAGLAGSGFRRKKK
ncbi:MAG: PEP-CTERM sorting domain-containing protein [Candidatus Electrothrix sp. AX5]|nr:PEP-CTERM sorting domain-containing protein [Candidatus Electrothrix sp. AX5]